MKVKIYKNIRTKEFSVLRAGHVKWRVHSFSLNNAKFEINTAAQKRVRENKRKNVHAFITGEAADLSLTDFDGLQGMRWATYDPYKYDTFVDGETGKPIHKANRVIGLPQGRIYYA